MMSAITLWSKSLFCLFIGVGLSACTTLAASYRAEKITWSTPYLNQAECPNLDGAYEDRALLGSFLIHLVANLQRSGDEGTFKSTEYARTAHAERYETKPYKVVPYGLIRFSTREDQQAYEREEAIFLRDKAVLELKRVAPYVMETVRADKNGMRYSKNVYKFEKMNSRLMVGCYQASFVIRKIVLISGEHTPAARTQANETHFRRLPNGDLQVIDTERTWSPASEAPRTKTTTEVFKFYRP